MTNYEKFIEVFGIDPKIKGTHGNIFKIDQDFWHKEYDENKENLDKKEYQPK